MLGWVSGSLKKKQQKAESFLLLGKFLPKPEQVDCVRTYVVSSQTRTKVRPASWHRLYTNIASIEINGLSSSPVHQHVCTRESVKPRSQISSLFLLLSLSASQSSRLAHGRCMQRCFLGGREGVIYGYAMYVRKSARMSFSCSFSRKTRYFVLERKMSDFFKVEKSTTAV